MNELENFVKMMDRAGIRIRIEEQGAETHVFVVDSGTEYIFRQNDELTEVW